MLLVPSWQIKEMVDLFPHVMPIDSVIINLFGRAVHRDAHLVISGFTYFFESRAPAS